MKRLGTKSVLLLMTGFAAVVVTACSGEDEGDTSSASTALGPECEKQYGGGNCCVEQAGEVQAAKDGCASAKKAIEDAIKQGKTAIDFEPSCKQLNESAKTAGYCLGPPEPCSARDACQGCTTCEDWCRCQPDYLPVQFDVDQCLQYPQNNCQAAPVCCAN
jgi:hypothetical protein